MVASSLTMTRDLDATQVADEKTTEEFLYYREHCCIILVRFLHIINTIMHTQFTILDAEFIPKMCRFL